MLAEHDRRAFAEFASLDRIDFNCPERSIVFIAMCTVIVIPRNPQRSANNSSIGCSLYSKPMFRVSDSNFVARRSLGEERAVRIGDYCAKH